MYVVVEAYSVICTYPCQPHLESHTQAFQMYGGRCGLEYMGICIRNSLEIRNAPPPPIL